MIYLRSLFSFFIAIVIVFSLFWILQNMVNVGTDQNLTSKSLQMVDFIKLKKQQTIEKKQRVKPKKPKPKKKPVKPKVNIQKDLKMVKQPMVTEKLNLNLPLNLSSISALGDAFVDTGGQAISTNVIPLSKVSPRYPRRAKRMGKEGYVKLEFTITKLGTVKDVTIVVSEPEGLFDSSAKRAILKWKFRPKIEEGSPVEQRALLQIDFDLNR